MSATTFYIKGFDGLRAVSIIMVLCTHIGIYDNWSHDGWVNSLTHTITGSVGVNIFFVISGFLITTLLLNEKQRTGTIHYKNFIIRRFLRLLPTLLLFYATILFLIYADLLAIKPIAVLLSACYLYNYVPNPLYFNELGHTWSLAVEEQFYVFWPWVIYAFRKQAILLTTTLLVVIAIVAVYYVPGIRVFYENTPHVLAEPFHVTRFFFPAVAPIMMGCGFATLNYFNAAAVKKFISKKPVVMLFMLLIFSAFLLPESFFDYLFLLQSLGFAALLTYIFCNQSAGVTSVLQWKPLVFIGKISYGIYVWQGLFLGTGVGGKLWVQHPVQNIMLTFLVAIVSYYFVEKKALLYKSSYQV